MSGICAKRTYVRLDSGAAISHDAAAMVTATEQTVEAASVRARSRTQRKVRCEDCYFHQNMLCALEEKKPCPTFRPAHPDGLRPPRQLSFVFRQGRRADPFEYETTPA